MKKTLGFLVAAAFAVSAISTPFAAAGNGLEGTEKFLAKKFNLTDVTKEFKTLKVKTDNLGMRHVKLQQTVNGIPVFGGQYIVHFDKAGNVYSSNGNFDTNAKAAKTSTTVTAKDAIEIAKAQVNYKEVAPTAKLQADKIEPNLYLYEVNGAYMPVYIVKVDWLHENTFGNWSVFVNANTGEVVKTMNNIKHGKPTGGGGTTNPPTTGTNTVGTGLGVLGDSKNINLLLNNGTYYLQDMTKTAAIYTYSANNGTTLPGTIMTDVDTTWNAEAQKAGVDAHHYAGVVFDFYNTLFGRNSIDNNGMAIKSTVHYDVNYVNAFWNGTQMVYGDGDGVEALALSGGLDIIAHEMSHGVDEFEANLVYELQPGALNESWSDVMGAAVEFWAQPEKGDWLMGEDIWTPGTPGDALRSLEDPTLYGDPDHMSKYNNMWNTPFTDYGGVHTNSGIPNHAAYTVGSQIGWEKMARVWYRAMDVYFTTSTNFSQARATTLQAAADLYGTGSVEYNAVAAGWDHVGVY